MRITEAIEHLRSSHPVVWLCLTQAAPIVAIGLTAAVVIQCWLS